MDARQEDRLHGIGEGHLGVESGKVMVPHTSRGSAGRASERARMHAHDLRTCMISK